MTIATAEPTMRSSVPEDLLLACQQYRDTQQLRIATSNRIAALERETDGHPPDLRVYQAQLLALKRQEEVLKRRIEKFMLGHPLQPWIAERHGIGSYGIARLLAIVLTVSWKEPKDEPAEARRGPAELWAYCGLAPGQKLRRGQRCNWSTAAKIAARSLAEGCIKAGGDSEYERLYRSLRARYEHRTHSEPCAQCGTPGKPAPAGSPWRPGHQQASAIRVTAKRILRDLFIECRRLGI